MTRPTITHDDDKVEMEHAVNRRQLLLGGTVLGAATLTGTGIASADNGMEPRADPSTPVVPSEELAIPARHPGMEMLTVSPCTAGVDWFNRAPQVTGYGAYVSGYDPYLIKALNVPPGSRIRYMTLNGWSTGGARNQGWFLRAQEPTSSSSSNMHVNVWYKTYSVNGRFQSPLEPVNILVQPGYAYEMWTYTWGASSPYLYDRGLTLEYQAPAGVFFPTSPKRVYDSRVSGGRIYSGQERLVSVRTQLGTGTTVVPQGARAVALNVTLDATQATGWLSVRPQNTSFDNTSSINWFTSNEIIANGVTSQLGGDREVRVRCGGGGSTHFLLDVVGYYI